MRPKHLAMALSKLTPHPCTDVSLEQYATEGDLAAYWMLAVDQMDQVENRHIADLGAGNGVLGIACLLLGAAHVHFYECDEQTVEVLEMNLGALNHSFSGEWTVHHALVGEDEIDLREVDIVLMNPPGVSKKARQIVHFLKRHLPAVPRAFTYSTVQKQRMFKPLEATMAGSMNMFFGRISDSLQPTAIIQREKERLRFCAGDFSDQVTLVSPKKTMNEP